MTKPLLVKSGGFTGDGKCARLLFWRPGTGEYECYVALYAARNDNYLRSLVEFMEHKVPHR